MTYVTEILANEPGIQYQGVKDKTGGAGVNPIAGLITGVFKRGRFDKPMTITNANIRAMLGYDPKNPSYTAVQDALNSGVPSVQVLRLQGLTVDYAYVSLGFVDNGAELLINGESFDLSMNFNDLLFLLFQAGLGIYSTFDSLGCFYLQRFQNLTDKPLNIELRNAKLFEFGLMILEPQENKTIRGSITGGAVLSEGVNNIQFTLAPNNNFPLIRPDLVIFRENNSLNIFPKNSNNEVYQYQFAVNDKIIVNQLDSGNIFTIDTPEGIASLSVALNEAGVINQRYLSGNHYSIRFYARVGEHFKLLIKQLGNRDDVTKIYFEAGMKTNTPTELSYEGYAYDPLNLQAGE